MTTRLKQTGWILFCALFPLAAMAQTPDTLGVSLEIAIEAALSDNPTIQIAEQELRRVDYSKKETWYGLIPSLSASAQAAKYVVPAKMAMFGTVMDSWTDYTVTATLSLSLPIVVPTLWQAIQMTELQMQMAVEQARASKINLRNEVVKAYYQILLAQDSYQTLKEGYEVAKQNWEEANRRFDLGLAAEYDCVFAEVQMENLIPTMLQIENGIVLSKSFLKVLMGLEFAVPIKTEGKLTDFEHFLSLNIDPSEASLAHNSDLALMDIQLELLERQLKLQRAMLLPTLVGFSQFGYNGTGTKDVSITLGGMPMALEARQDWFPNGLLVGLQLNVPIFSGFTNKMKEKQISVSSKKLQIQRSYVEENLRLQVSSAIDNMARALKQSESAKKGVMLAEKGYQISVERYNNGMSTMLELRASSQALTQSKLAYSQAISDYLGAKAEYEKVTGIVQ